MTWFVGCALLLAARQDYKTKEIYDRYWLFILSLAILRLNKDGHDFSVFLVGLLGMSFTLLLVSLLSKGSLGGGDIKLFAALGAYLGIAYALALLFLSLVVFVIACVLQKKQGGALAPSIFISYCLIGGYSFV